jgi:phosphoglycolate phosphatase-like HAD superfamily hydrolase
MRLAVLTNNSVASAEAALERFDLRAPFDLVLARERVPALKPAGDGVAQAHAALGGGQTYVVGDAYLDGLAAERAALAPGSSPSAPARPSWLCGASRRGQRC